MGEPNFDFAKNQKKFQGIRSLYGLLLWDPESPHDPKAAMRIAIEILSRMILAHNPKWEFKGGDGFNRKFLLTVFRYVQLIRLLILFRVSSSQRKLLSDQKYQLFKHNYNVGWLNPPLVVDSKSSWKDAVAESTYSIEDAYRNISIYAKKSGVDPYVVMSANDRGTDLGTNFQSYFFRMASNAEKYKDKRDILNDVRFMSDVQVDQWDEFLRNPSIAANTGSVKIISSVFSTKLATVGDVEESEEEEEETKEEKKGKDSDDESETEESVEPRVEEPVASNVEEEEESESEPEIQLKPRERKRPEKPKDPDTEVETEVDEPESEPESEPEALPKLEIEPKESKTIGTMTILPKKKTDKRVSFEEEEEEEEEEKRDEWLEDMMLHYDDGNIRGEQKLIESDRKDTIESLTVDVNRLSDDRPWNESEWVSVRSLMIMIISHWIQHQNEPFPHYDLFHKQWSRIYNQITTYPTIVGPFLIASKPELSEFEQDQRFAFWAYIYVYYQGRVSDECKPVNKLVLNKIECTKAKSMPVPATRATQTLANEFAKVYGLVYTEPEDDFSHFVDNYFQMMDPGTSSATLRYELWSELCMDIAFIKKVFLPIAESWPVSTKWPVLLVTKNNRWYRRVPDNYELDPNASKQPRSIYDQWSLRMKGFPSTSLITNTTTAINNQLLKRTIDETDRNLNKATSLTRDKFKLLFRIILYRLYSNVGVMDGEITRVNVAEKMRLFQQNTKPEHMDPIFEHKTSTRWWIDQLWKTKAMTHAPIHHFAKALIEDMFFILFSAVEDPLHKSVIPPQLTWPNPSTLVIQQIIELIPTIGKFVDKELKSKPKSRADLALAWKTNVYDVINNGVVANKDWVPLDMLETVVQLITGCNSLSETMKKKMGGGKFPQLSKEVMTWLEDIIRDQEQKRQLEQDWLRAQEEEQRIIQKQADDQRAEQERLAEQELVGRKVKEEGERRVNPDDEEKSKLLNKEEEERLEKERLDARIKSSAEELERRELERIKKEDLDREERERYLNRLEQERLEKEQREIEEKRQLELDKTNYLKMMQLVHEEKERRDREEKEKERRDQEEKERLEQEEKMRLDQIELDRFEREEKERFALKEKEREEKERLEREKEEQFERERLQFEKEEQSRLKREEQERLERVRLEREEKERLDREKREQEEKRRSELQQEKKRTSVQVEWKEEDEDNPETVEEYIVDRETRITTTQELDEYISLRLSWAKTAYRSSAGVFLNIQLTDKDKVLSLHELKRIMSLTIPNHPGKNGPLPLSPIQIEHVNDALLFFTGIPNQEAWKKVYNGDEIIKCRQFRRDFRRPAPNVLVNKYGVPFVIGTRICQVPKQLMSIFCSSVSEPPRTSCGWSVVIPSEINVRGWTVESERKTIFFANAAPNTLVSMDLDSEPFGHLDPALTGDILLLSSPIDYLYRLLYYSQFHPLFDLKTIDKLGTLETTDGIGNDNLRKHIQRMKEQLPICSTINCRYGGSGTGHQVYGFTPQLFVDEKVIYASIQEEIWRMQIDAAFRTSIIYGQENDNRRHLLLCFDKPIDGSLTFSLTRVLRSKIQAYIQTWNIHVTILVANKQMAQRVTKELVEIKHLMIVSNPISQGPDLSSGKHNHPPLPAAKPSTTKPLPSAKPSFTKPSPPVNPSSTKPLPSAKPSFTKPLPSAKPSTTKPPLSHPPVTPPVPSPLFISSPIVPPFSRSVTKPTTITLPLPPPRSPLSSIPSSVSSSAIPPLLSPSPLSKPTPVPTPISRPVSGPIHSPVIGPVTKPLITPIWSPPPPRSTLSSATSSSSASSSSSEASSSVPSSSPIGPFPPSAPASPTRNGPMETPVSIPSASDPGNSPRPSIPSIYSESVMSQPGAGSVLSSSNVPAENAWLEFIRLPLGIPANFLSNDLHDSNENSITIRRDHYLIRVNPTILWFMTAAKLISSQLIADMVTNQDSMDTEDETGSLFNIAIQESKHSFQYWQFLRMGDPLYEELKQHMTEGPFVIRYRRAQWSMLQLLIEQDQKSPNYKTKYDIYAQGLDTGFIHKFLLILVYFFFPLHKTKETVRKPWLESELKCRQYLQASAQHTLMRILRQWGWGIRSTSACLQIVDACLWQCIVKDFHNDVLLFCLASAMFLPNNSSVIREILSYTRGKRGFNSIVTQIQDL